MDKTNIKEILKSNDTIHTHIFYCLIARPQKKITKNNTSFLNLYLVDQTAEINAKKWDISSFDEQNLLHGKVAEIQGKLSDFQGNKQIIISNWKIINDDELKESLFPQAPYSIEKMWKEFQQFIEEIKDMDYSKLIKTIFKLNFEESFKKHQAGLSIHHNVRGGLLWHTLTMLKLANKVIEIYDYVKINKSLLYAGIMLHDIGKISEINADLPEKYSLKGKLLGHISIGSEISKKYGEKLNLPEEKIDLLQHMILSSHGKLEHGSPIRPILIESFILSQLDDFDSKTNAIWKNLEQVFPNEFTKNIFALDNDHFFHLPPAENENN